MFLKKRDELISGMPNVFGIADDILVASFYGLCRDHDATLDNMFRISRQANLRLKKGKCIFRCISISFSGEVTSLLGISSDPRKLQTLTDMPLPNSKIELQSFLGILSYWSKLLPAVAQVCKPLQSLTSGKANWAWNRMYEDIY